MNELKSSECIMNFIDYSLYTRSYVKHQNSGPGVPRTKVVQREGDSSLLSPK